MFYWLLLVLLVYPTIIQYCTLVNAPSSLIRHFMKHVWQHSHWMINILNVKLKYCVWVIHFVFRCWNSTLPHIYWYSDISVCYCYYKIIYVLYSHQRLSLSTTTVFQFSERGGGAASLIPASDPPVNLSHHIRWRYAFAYFNIELEKLL